jgi:hypothetical protein
VDLNYAEYYGKNIGLEICYYEEKLFLHRRKAKAEAKKLELNKK